MASWGEGLQDGWLAPPTIRVGAIRSQLQGRAAGLSWWGGLIRGTAGRGERRAHLVSKPALDWGEKVQSGASQWGGPQSWMPVPPPDQHSLTTMGIIATSC